MIVRKSKSEIEKMRRSGQLVAAVFKELTSVIRPGITTGELDRIAEEIIRSAGAIPTFKGYRIGSAVFPATLCISVDDEIVHGIPGERVLVEGEIVSIDCGATLDGYVGDSAMTFPIGEISQDAQALLKHTRLALYQAIDQCRIGRRVGDIGHAVEEYILPLGYGIVEDFCGHGVGRKMHEEPQVPNYGDAGSGKRLKQGWCIAIEPMINLGTKETRVLADQWTVKTADGSISAHFEHSIAVTNGAPIILTSRGDDPPGDWIPGTSRVY